MPPKQYKNQAFLSWDLWICGLWESLKDMKLRADFFFPAYVIHFWGEGEGHQILKRIRKNKRIKMILSKSYGNFCTDFH